MLTIPIDGDEFRPQPVDGTPVFVSPLPALTTVRVQLGSRIPTTRLARLLSSIHPAPNLCTVFFTCSEWVSPRDFTSLGPWSVVDEWLAHLLMARFLAGGSLEVVLTHPMDRPGCEGCFPEFRSAGGEFRREPLDYDVWGLMTTFALW